MANDYFKFKKFTVFQSDCAMKVCTDACLFGAILPKEFESNCKALDIGSGTGLLSLMFTQNNPTCKIDAVEIDELATIQCKQNVELSSWQENINVHHSDIKAFQSNTKYDCIFSNPPFYSSDLKGNDDKKNVAKHHVTLKFSELLNSVKQLLKINGIFYVLIPFSLEEEFIKKATDVELFPLNITRVKQTNLHNYFRSIICFTDKPQQISEAEISIKVNNEYSAEFKALLQDFYLYL